MSTAEQIDDLMHRWEEARQQGQPLSPEDLCAECPELAAAVRERMDVVEAMERVLGVDGGLVERTIAAPRPAECTTDTEPLPNIPGYEIIRVIDRGGMGVVYQAKQVQLGRIVAIKMISGGRLGPRFLARFRAEAEAAARLQHPNIVQIFEVGQVAGQPFYSMEFVAGGSLAQWIEHERLPPRATAELMQTLAGAIHTAHQNGVVHRDLKPANILMSSSASQSLANRSTASAAKIADFGLAKRLDDVAGHTHTGEILGTPSYMAPEQALGHKDQIGPATDVYALGAILYEMLAGRPPHQADSVLRSLHLVDTEEPVAPSRLSSSVPRDLEAICLKCLEKAPEQRYTSAQDLAVDLARFLDGRPVVARRIGPVRRLAKWLRRHPVEAALLLVVSGVALVPVLLFINAARVKQAMFRKAEEQAPLVREILERNCFECHGRDPKNTKKNLNVLDHQLLLDSDRKLVVPGAPQDSRLMTRIADGSMPPEEEEARLPRLTEQEVAILNDWILGGAPPFPTGDPLPPMASVTPSPEVAAEAKAIFKLHCYECHNYNIAKGGIKILHHRLLVNLRKVVIPFRPEQSELYLNLTTPDESLHMPPPSRDPLDAEEIAVIRRWIAEGAPPFPRTE